MKKVDFEVGVKFIYFGEVFPKERGRVQEVLHILTINGIKSIRAKFIDNQYVHIFEDRGYNKNHYSNFCYPIDIKLDNGIPMFWEYYFND